MIIKYALASPYSRFHTILNPLFYPSLGRPEPTVTWWINGTPGTQYIGMKTDVHVVVNRLELPHLKREDLNTTFKCRAANTNLVPPQEKSVRLEMNCKF